MAQVLAALLLLVFLAQGTWLILRGPLNNEESGFINGQDDSNGGGAGDVANPAQFSMLTARMARWIAWIEPAPMAEQRVAAARLPFLLFGTMLGASVWYVARRLYGNAGGYIALALFVFSPIMLTYAARVQPNIATTWAIFGCIFTAIAVAHTLYAPREVVLWNWRRILLLGLAIGLGAASSFPTIYAIPVALGFMLWVVPERRAAAVAIMGAACLVGTAIVVAVYSFDLMALAHAFARSGLFDVRLAGVMAAGRMAARFFLRNGPGSVLLLVVALVTYAAWPRARFFGNTAPLLITAMLILAVIVLPHAAGVPFLVAALPFTFVFIAGVFADLLETRQGSLVLGVLLAVVVANALFSISALTLLRR